MSDGNVNNHVQCITVATQTVFLTLSLSLSEWLCLLPYSVQVRRSLNQFWISLSLCHSRSHPSSLFPFLRPRVSFFCCQSPCLRCLSLSAPPLPFYCRLSWINAALAAVTFRLRSCLLLPDPLPSLCLSTSVSRINVGFSHCHIVAQGVFYWSCQGADLSMSRGRKRDASMYDRGREGWPSRLWV